ncbi:MAG: TAXI family TRAP transporter solute-binding subunit, partial [Bacteroidota bacterium]
YGRYPEAPILTVAVDAMLLAHRDVDPTVVSDLIRVIMEDKPMLSHYNILLGQISDDFDFNGLDFPLHPGAVQYLERDKPTFLERYAEVLALFLTLTVVGAGGYRRYQQRLNQQKKDRIDVYYKKLLEIERDAPSLNTLAEIEAMEDKIQQLRRHAFDALIVERLRADESFRIFVTLSNDVLRELERRKLRLQGRRDVPPPPGGERSDE